MYCYYAVGVGKSRSGIQISLGLFLSTSIMYDRLNGKLNNNLMQVAQILQK